jgi:hypothetical protein
MNRAFSKILILVILGIFVAGGFFAWQYFGALKEKVKDETADWKTYQNEEYGFGMKYPQDWNHWSEVYTEGFSKEFVKEQNDIVCEFSVNMIPTVNLDNYIEELYPQGSPNPARIETEVDDFPAVKIEEFPHTRRYWVRKEANNLSFQITQTVKIIVGENRNISYGYGTIQDSECEEPFDQMLSTFRFIEGDKTAGWKLESIDGFSFKIYKSSELVKTITREEIVNEFKKKYGPDESIGSSMVTRFIANPIEFIYDSKNQRILLPITPAQVAGSTYGWDFYIFDVRTNQFSIAPGKRPSSSDEKFPTGIRPSNFTISPSGKYLAYRFGYAGGTCVLGENPEVINLDTFSSIDIVDKAMQIADAVKREAGLTTFPPTSYYSFTYAVNNIQWDSDYKLKVAMTFGGICPLGLKNVPDEIKTNVEFTISP